MRKDKYKISKKQLYNLYWNKELSLKKIAKLYECSPITIYSKMLKYNIMRRVCFHLQKNRKNPNFKLGYYCRDKKYYCILCKINKIHVDNFLNGSKMCRSCSMKTYWKKHPERNNPKPKCISCNKQLTNYNTKRCNKCRGFSQRGRKNPNYGNHKLALSNHPNWKGGKSFEPYTLEWTSFLKNKIKKRDNYQCQNCSMTEEEHLIVYGRRLSIHHIDYDKMNCKEDNLITTCQPCNVRANYNRDYWQEYYKNLIIDNKKQIK